MKTPLHFPKDFVWGVATSAYQIEGAANADGKKDSIWDVFCRKPGAIAQGETGEIAIDHYHRWKEDIAIMKELGIQSYRFSLSWPRIIPDGDGIVNEAGLAFYDQLIDELLRQGIEPAITLFHWDLPQALQEKGGWSSRKTVDAFVKYASVTFKRYSDRVNIWMTHNEPSVVVNLGHLLGIHAPGIQDPEQAIAAAHHLLLSHGAAVKIMRQLASPTFKGKIGIAVNISAVHPKDPSRREDVMAAQQHHVRAHHLYLDPIFKGHYPEQVLKEFSSLHKLIHKGDMQTIHEPIDFLGINYYSRTIIRGEEKEGIISSIWQPPPNNPYSLMWDFYPEGLQEVIEEVWKRYIPKEIYMTENGTSVVDTVTEGKIHDIRRIEYLESHLKILQQLIQSSIPVKRYYAWSLFDNFEWALGYQMRFGLIYVDYSTLKRTIKDSGYWYKKIIQQNS